MGLPSAPAASQARASLRVHEGAPTVYRKFGEETLRTGEVMEVGCVEPPDEDWGERVEESLSHKPPIWQYHIHKAIRGETDELRNHFYIGCIQDELVTGVMTVEYRRVGILGHVYTQPAYRRKGAYSSLMEYQMEDFRKRGGGVLLLGTGYHTPPFWIYQSFGFQPFAGKSGYMRYATEEDLEDTYYTPGDVSIRELHWGDWPGANLLTSQPGDDLLRSFPFKLGDISSFEEGFLHLKQGLEEDRRCRAWAAESDSGALVGMVMLTPDEQFNVGAYFLDLVVHQDFWDHAEKLLHAARGLRGTVQCYTDLACQAKVSALEAAGFSREPQLKRQLRVGRQTLDVAVFTREVR